MKSPVALASLTLAFLLGCSGAPESPASDGPEAELEGTVSSALTPCDTSSRGRRTFFTRNVNLGFAVEPVLAASSIEEVPGLVAEAWAQMESNDFGARAALLAGEIASLSPDAIGLQEAAIVRRFSASGAAPIEFDYLAILQSALAARGLRYVAVVVQNDTDVTVPMFAGFDPSGAPILDGVQIVDRDVVLVREGVRTSRPESARFQVGIPVALGDAPVEVVRGWASVVVHTSDGPFRFVNTHLEDLVPEVQLAQASELLGIVNSDPLPVVLVGDLNARSNTPTYGLFTGAGFVDSWAQANPRDPGFTCCQDVDLKKTLPFTERIDYVLARSPGRPARIRGEVKARIVGANPRVRTASGLWASDHAGLGASFAMPRMGN